VSFCTENRLILSLAKATFNNFIFQRVREIYKSYFAKLKPCNSRALWISSNCTVSTILWGFDCKVSLVNESPEKNDSENRSCCFLK
jgi:hypothetical protein